MFSEALGQKMRRGFRGQKAQVVEGLLYPLSKAVGASENMIKSVFRNVFALAAGWEWNAVAILAAVSLGLRGGTKKGTEKNSYVDFVV